MLALPAANKRLQLTTKPTSQSKGKVYNSIKSLYKKANIWKQILKNQLNLKPIIVQFQNFDITAVSYNKKQALRQSFLVKKEIIKCINDNNNEQLMDKVQTLSKMASSESQQFKLNSLIALLKIREVINNDMGQFRYATLQYIERTLPANFCKTQQTSIIFIKIYCLLCIFLLKVKGILMKQSQRSIIQKALDLKKRQFINCESEPKKFQIIKTLIFLKFQFYNIIFLLKSDQNLILYVYNRLCSYIDLIKTHFKNYQQIQSEFQIQEQLKKMKPLYLTIYIYDDSKKRRELSLKNAQDQMLNKHYQLPESLIIRKKQNFSLKPLNEKKINANSKSRAQPLNLKRNSSSLFRRSITGQLQKQTVRVINQPRTSSKYNKKSQQSQKLSINYNKISKVFNEISYMFFSQEQFCFKFILIHSQKLYKGQFKCTLKDHSHNLLSLKITLKGPTFYDSIIHSENIENCLQKIQMNVFCKMLWKLVKILLNQPQFKYMFISDDEDYAQQSLPFHINRQYELQTLTQIHELILYFFRKKSLSKAMTGESFPYLQIDNKKLLESYKKYNNQKGIFTKRKGFIYKNPSRSIQQNLTSITFCYHQQDSFKIIRFLYNRGIFKQAIICSISKKFQCKKIEKRIKDESFFKKLIKTRTKKETIAIIANLSCKSIDGYLKSMKQSYWAKNTNIQQQFEILRNPVLNKATGPVIHQYFQPKIKRIQRLAPPILKRTIKLSSIYKVFSSFSYECCTRLINEKLQIIQPRNCTIDVYRYQRLRMYKTAFIIRNGIYEKYCLSKMNMNEKPYAKTQNIGLKLIKHKILKENKRYYMIIQYDSKKFGKIYEIVATSGNQKYCYFGQENMQQLNLQWDKKVVNGCQLRKIDCKGPLSDLAIYLEKSIIGNQNQVGPKNINYSIKN